MDPRTLETNKNCLVVAAAIEEAPPSLFDMTSASDLATSCGTPACIAGWTAHALPGCSRDHEWDPVLCAEKLGMTDNYHDTFFFPKARDGTALHLVQVTQSMAVAHLRRYAATGEQYFDLND